MGLSPHTVADVGCGTGRVLSEFKRRLSGLAQHARLAMLRRSMKFTRWLRALRDAMCDGLEGAK